MTTDQFQFDTGQIGGNPDIFVGIRKAVKSGKKMPSMLMEIAKLRMGPGKLKPEEYFMYELYDDDRFDAQTRKTFLSGTGKTYDSPWRVIAEDKPLMTSMLKGLGLPVPETQAIYHRIRTFDGAAELRTPEDMVEFLRNQANYPIFGKPFGSCQSKGTALLASYDKASDQLIIGANQRVSVVEFADTVEKLNQPYMFQTKLQPHAEITKMIGPSVSCVRMFYISDDRGCSLLRAAWKIPADSNSADNFWRDGNMLAGINLETGKIEKAVQRSGSSTGPVEKHPETGVSFSDMVFPDWDKMLEVANTAALNIPDCYFQGWDIAMTDQGPVILELEADGGNPILGQLCHDKGVLDERYQHALDYAVNREKREKEAVKKQKMAKVKNSFAALSQFKEAQENLREDADSSGTDS